MTEGDGLPSDGSGPPLKAAPLEYPLLYMFKAMGLAAPGFREHVVQLISEVAGPIDATAVTVRPSSAGKYESISVHVFLKAEDERRRIYEALHADKSIVWYV